MVKVLLGVGALAVLAVAALLLCRAADARTVRSAWRVLAAQAPAAAQPFDPAMVADLPEPARRYFGYVIAPGTALSGVAQITMGGVLGLGTRAAPGYRPMRARQILAAPRGFVWRLNVGLIGGSDGILEGRSWTRFWLGGLVPVARAGGSADHARSAFGRAVAEAVFWAPASLLPAPGVRWEAAGPDTARVTVRHLAFEQSVDVSLAPDGQPISVVFSRWSDANPDGVWQFQPFGGTLSRFRDFGGYRLPTRVEAGNFFGTPDYFPFYRAEIEDVRVLFAAGG